MTLEDAQPIIADHMDGILGCFKPGVKIAVLVRTPGFPERDFLMTDDVIPELMNLLARRAAVPADNAP